MAVIAATAAVGCSSSPSAADEARMTQLRHDFCLRLGEWEKARNAAPSRSPEEPMDTTTRAAADSLFAAARDLKDEGLPDGRTSLLEDTTFAVTDGQRWAEGRLVQYCGDAGFETYPRF